jgi:hypothetical protein
LFGHRRIFGHDSISTNGVTTVQQVAQHCKKQDRDRDRDRDHQNVEMPVDYTADYYFYSPIAQEN